MINDNLCYVASGYREHNWARNPTDYRTLKSITTGPFMSGRDSSDGPLGLLSFIIDCKPSLESRVFEDPSLQPVSFTWK